MMSFETEEDILHGSSQNETEANIECMDKELEEEILYELSKIKLDEDVLISDDWEDLIMLKASSNKRQRTS